MASKTAAKKWISSMFVVSAYRIHKEEIVKGVAELAGGGSEPEATFFFQPAKRPAEETTAATEVFLDYLIDNLEHRANVMIAADEAKLGELDTEILTRKERADIAKELREQYMKQRDAFINLYNEDTARRAGFEFILETEPVMVMFQVRRVVNGLTSGKLELGETFGGLRVDAEPYGRALEPKLVELETKLRQVHFDQRTTQGRLRLKNLAMRAYDAVFTPGARCLEAAFRLAGMPELADLVRPSERRPGRREDEVIAEEDTGTPAPGFEALGIEQPSLPGSSDPTSEESTGKAEPEPEEPEGQTPPSDG